MLYCKQQRAHVSDSRRLNIIGGYTVSTNTTNKNSRQNLQQQYNSARANLLVALIFTVVNIVLLFIESDTMFLFSMSVPYFAAVYGYFFRLAQYSGLFAACVTVAAVVLVVYLLCWIFSKKHYNWMLVAMIMFIVDTITLAGFYILAEDVTGVLDALFHVWVLYYLIVGVIAGTKLKKLPAEEPIPQIATDGEPVETSELADTAPLRYADMAEKFRVLLEADAHGKHICYRRVKRVNELVINGYVYAEFEALVEPPHELSATLGGHTFSAGTDKSSRSYIKADGEILAKKLRLY